MTGPRFLHDTGRETRITKALAGSGCRRRSRGGAPRPPWPTGRPSQGVVMPARLTSRPRTLKSRTRMVRAMVSRSTRTWPTKRCRPANEVVGQHSALQPGAVGDEVAGGSVVRRRPADGLNPSLIPTTSRPMHREMLSKAEAAGPRCADETFAPADPAYSVAR